MTQEDTYEVRKVRDGQEVSPIQGDKGTVAGQEITEVTCPSCGYLMNAADLVLEGGSVCDGCERPIRLHITTHHGFAEWRNVPEHEEETYR